MRKIVWAKRFLVSESNLKFYQIFITKSSQQQVIKQYTWFYWFYWVWKADLQKKVFLIFIYK